MEVAVAERNHKCTFGSSCLAVKWGNRLAVMLPALLVEALKLKEGDDIEIQVAGERSFDIKQVASPRELLLQLRRLCGNRPAWAAVNRFILGLQMFSDRRTRKLQVSRYRADALLAAPMSTPDFGYDFHG